MTVAGNGSASAGPASDTPTVLVVGSGYRPYREYILRALSRHYRLWLLDTREATWQLRYVVGATQVSFGDLETVRAAAREVAERIPVTGSSLMTSPRWSAVLS